MKSREGLARPDGRLVSVEIRWSPYTFVKTAKREIGDTRQLGS